MVVLPTRRIFSRYFVKKPETDVDWRNTRMAKMSSEVVCRMQADANLHQKMPTSWVPRHAFLGESSSVEVGVTGLVVSVERLQMRRIHANVEEANATCVTADIAAPLVGSFSMLQDPVTHGRDRIRKCLLAFEVAFVFRPSDVVARTFE